MADQRGGGIDWTDQTWNPVRGCSRVSPGCEHCYAERTAARFSGPGQPYEGLARIVTKERVLRRDFRNGSIELRKVEDSYPRWTGEVRLVPEHLADPLRWKRPRRIFVNSMSDLFHEKLTNEEIAAVFGVMAAAPAHTFQVLTKRPERMLEWFGWVGRKGLGRYIGQACGDAAEALGAPVYVKGRDGRSPWNNCTCLWPLPNVWLGVTAEDQRRANERIPLLLKTPAAVRFVSVEPQLERVDLSPYLTDDLHRMGRAPRMEIDWVICGAESGPGARPFDEAWARSLRDQCAGAGVAFFYKQRLVDGRKVHTPALDGRLHVEFPR